MSARRLRLSGCACVCGISHEYDSGLLEERKREATATCASAHGLADSHAHEPRVTKRPRARERERERLLSPSLGVVATLRIVEREAAISSDDGRRELSSGDVAKPFFFAGDGGALSLEGLVLVRGGARE